MIRHVGSSLSDVTYVFDEPTAGLHPADVERLDTLLLRLRDKGNTVLVVEHRPQTIEIADRVVELGPGAGTAGGAIVFEGSVEELRRTDTVTGRHMDVGYELKADAECRTGDGVLEIRGAAANNLHDLDVDVPRGTLTAITGVAGSGKSSLLGAIEPDEKTVWVDQSPISGSRRSNPATYTGALDPIRKAFAKENGSSPRSSPPTPRARARTATAPGWSTWTWASCRASTCPARSARVGASTRRCSSTASAGWTSPRCSTYRPPRPRSSSPTPSTGCPRPHGSRATWWTWA